MAFILVSGHLLPPRFSLGFVKKLQLAWWCLIILSFLFWPPCYFYIMLLATWAFCQYVHLEEKVLLEPQPPRCTGKLGRLKISMAMKLAETLGSAYRENLQYPNHTANVHIPLGFLCDFMVTNSLNNTSECQQCKKINTTHDQGKPKRTIILVHNKQLPWVTNNSEIGNPI